MCGIAGMILRRGSPDSAALTLAAARLGHRGPDDSGVYRVDSVGLAHTRLSIIDLGGGHQPILDTDGHYALVANGEIYTSSCGPSWKRTAAVSARTRTPRPFSTSTTVSASRVSRVSTGCSRLPSTRRGIAR